MLTDSRREQIASSLRSKKYRDAYVASLVSVVLPSQIREMRIRRGWSQAHLGRLSGMPQGQVSRFEQKGYRGFTLTTLRKLASAFDVAIKVRFVPFSELADEGAYPGKYDLDVLSFDEDTRLNASEAKGIFPFPLQDAQFFVTVRQDESCTVESGLQGSRPLYEGRHAQVAD